MSNGNPQQRQNKQSDVRFDYSASSKKRESAPIISDGLALFIYVTAILQIGGHLVARLMDGRWEEWNWETVKIVFYTLWFFFTSVQIIVVKIVRSNSE